MDGPQKLLIIGCGNMGGAMLVGWLSSGLDPARFAILDPALDEAPDGVPLYRTVSQAAAASHDAVMLGFKPQQMRDLAPELQQVAGEGTVLYSLLAGITLDQLHACFPDVRAHVRVMPNLASRINKSPIILLGRGLDEVLREGTFDFFDRLGTALWFQDEAKFDLVTALAGSGPGFVYRFIDALAEAAAALGMDRDEATRLSLAMVEGAAALAAQADVAPAELADRVASPGGMTREGLNVLDADGALVELLKRTLAATRDRGAELSSGAK